jgi:hypothetical protein
VRSHSENPTGFFAHQPSLRLNSLYRLHYDRAFPLLVLVCFTWLIIVLDAPR